MGKDALFRMSGHLIRLYCGWHSRGWRATGGYSLRAFWLRIVFVCNFADDFTLDLAEDFDADIGFAEDFDFGLGFVLDMNLQLLSKDMLFFPRFRRVLSPSRRTKSEYFLNLSSYPCSIMHCKGHKQMSLPKTQEKK